MFGHEHYAEHLEDLACAAAPVRHPISGKIIGAVDLTCWRKDANALLIALAHSTAGQITQALLNDSGAGEVQLLQEYLRACRHTGGIIFAINNDMVMMNRPRPGRARPRRPGRDARRMQPRRWPPAILVPWMSSCPPGPGRGCTAGPFAGRASGGSPSALRT